MISTVSEYDFTWLADIPVLRRGKGTHSRKEKYLDLVTAFDIETTNIDDLDQAVMYIWQFQITDEDTIIGRSWEEFRQLCRILSEYAGDNFIIVYVHNLSFEYQFIKSIIHIDTCFAMDNRKILKCVSQQLEFRCSYLHSNMSLDRYLANMGVPDRKVKGFDYDKKRYPWTPLTDEELHYCINDVKGLVEAIKIEMKKDGDNLYSIPLTSTGYARRDAKEVLGGYRRYIKPMLPDLEVFHALRSAFRGGNTHANRHNVNIIHKAEEGLPILSYDISSSYPAVMMTERFPGQFYKQDPDLLWLFLKHGQACLMHIRLHDVHLLVESFGCPYIPKAKCEWIIGGIYDNGRVLECQDCEMYITEVDFSILCREYRFEYQILELWTANKRKLPKKFRDMLMDQYRKKTELKGVDDYLCQKYKGRFNSNYGMMVQNPCKPEWILTEDGSLALDDTKPVEVLIDEYQKKGWLPYQWGVWVCAYARLKLEDGLHTIPYDSFLYCDTDSIKFVGDYKDNFEKLNENYHHEELSAIDGKGRKHYLGVFEPDEEYSRFITLGAKKYAYEDLDGQLHVTVSGVSKTKGAKELKKLENFKEGFVFYEAGGTENVYNDDPPLKHITIDGHRLDITSNVAIFPSTYTLDQTIEYKRLINFLMTKDIRYELHYER